MKESPSGFIGRISELNGVIFDTVSIEKADHCNAHKKDVTQCAGEEMKRGGDVQQTILDVKKFDIPRPKKPKKPTGLGLAGALTDEQEDDHEFEQDIHKQDVKAHVYRRDPLDKNMSKAHSIFIGQCTVTMMGRLESMPQ